MIAAYVTLWLLAVVLLPLGPPATTMIAIFSASLVWVFRGIVLASRLHRASLWAWFGAVSATAVGAGGPILLLVLEIQEGPSIPEAVAAAPSHAVLVPLSLGLLFLLMRRDVRSWLGTIQRLKSLPAAGVESLVARPTPSRGTPGASTMWP
jgi:hypothetical protein